MTKSLLVYKVDVKRNLVCHSIECFNFPLLLISTEKIHMKTVLGSDIPARSKCKYAHKNVHSFTDKTHRVRDKYGIWNPNPPQNESCTFSHADFCQRKCSWEAWRYIVLVFMCVCALSGVFFIWIHFFVSFLCTKMCAISLT